MYGTGMRIIEVIRLRVKDVDFGGGVILVRDGKGEKDRYVPLGHQHLESTLAYRRYLLPKDTGLLERLPSVTGQPAMGPSPLRTVLTGQQTRAP
jgi:site-specific recombinase XerD